MKQDVCLELPKRHIRKEQPEKMKAKKGYSRSFSWGLGVLFVLFAGSIVFSGCASTGDGPLAAAHRIHSMTPCGMMMNAMMGNGHGGSEGDGAYHEVASSIDTQMDSGQVEEHDVSAHATALQ
jgi:hypothetical protein